MFLPQLVFAIRLQNNSYQLGCNIFCLKKSVSEIKNNCFFILLRDTLLENLFGKLFEYFKKPLTSWGRLLSSSPVWVSLNKTNVATLTATVVVGNGYPENYAKSSTQGQCPLL
jgi:hypothetical protein